LRQKTAATSGKQTLAEIASLNLCGRAAVLGG
jgi:hypothetical protein